MSAPDRVRSYIRLTAPDGTVFGPKWIGDDVSLEKRIGKFEFPGVNGATVQDHGIGATDYPLTFYFDDLDHDRTVTEFMKAWTQTGVWTVLHPVLGAKKLQPVKLTAGIKPVENVLHTVVTSSWLEPLPDFASTVDLASDVTAGIDETNAGAQESLVAQLDQSTPDLVTQIIGTASQCLGIVRKYADDLSGAAGEIYAQIQAVLAGKPIDVGALAGAFQQLIQTPGLIQGDLTARLSKTSQIINQTTATLPSDSDPKSKASVLVTEAILTAVLTAEAQTAVTIEAGNREQAVEALKRLLADFSAVVTALEAVAAGFASRGIEARYFSHSGTYAQLVALVSASVRYLLTSAYDLKAARRIVLDRARCPLEIAVTEIGPDEADYLKFIADNHLTGDRIWLLPAGFEAVIYG